jgi:putative oxidoreductase
MKIGRLLLRLAVGGFFFGHGTQKLFGWFGGPGLDATAQGFHKMGMRPGRRNAFAAALTETVGGTAVALGAATPLVVAPLISVMLTAINRVHLKNGPWNSAGGYEYNVVLIAALLTLAEVGPGELSLDHALGQERYGPGWALAALALGAAGAAGAHIAAELEPPDAPTVPQPTSDGGIQAEREAQPMTPASMSAP